MILLILAYYLCLGEITKKESRGASIYSGGEVIVVKTRQKLRLNVGAA
jgi:hypothetical protein